MMTPDLAKMSLDELRIYFRTLRLFKAAVNAAQCHPLNGCVSTTMADWADDAFAWVDDAACELTAHLEQLRCSGRDESFRLCMLVEQAAWLTDIPEIRQVIAKSGGVLTS